MIRRDFNRLVGGTILVFAIVLVVEQTAAAECGALKKTAPRTTGVVETINFRIYGIGGLHDAARLANDFESLRQRLCRTWLGDKWLPTWSPKCDVVVHSTAGSYSQAVGQDQFATFGSSCIDLAAGRVSRRRIDIRADQTGWFAAAVPHELTHVIMADEFLGSEVPNWADEGMALLADSQRKQSSHLRDLDAGYRRGKIFRLGDFVCKKHYPAAAHIPVFYGQSISLAKFLIGRTSPADFVRFLHRIEQVGCDAAISEVYGFRGVAELERQWLEWLKRSPESQDALVLAPADQHAPAQPPRS